MASKAEPEGPLTIPSSWAAETRIGGAYYHGKAIGLYQHRVLREMMYGGANTGRNTPIIRSSNLSTKAPLYKRSLGDDVGRFRIN